MQNSVVLGTTAFIYATSVAAFLTDISFFVTVVFLFHEPFPINISLSAHAYHVYEVHFSSIYLLLYFL